MDTGFKGGFGTNGKGVFKGFVALLIALILAAAPVFVYAESDGSSGDNQSSGDSLTATKGTYWFDPHVTGTDLTDNYVYDDAPLTGDSLEFSWPLATMMAYGNGLMIRWRNLKKRILPFLSQ